MVVQNGVESSNGIGDLVRGLRRVAVVVVVEAGLARADGGCLRVEARPWRWASRWPKDVARLSGGFFVMSLQVRRGMEERKPLRTAFMSVEVAGEQKIW